MSTTVHLEHDETKLMTCYPLRSGSTLSPAEFVEQMNLAIKDSDDFQVGMCIKCDDNGYWLELDGQRVAHPLLLSFASKLVMQ